jgi:predicted esterase
LAVFIGLAAVASVAGQPSSDAAAIERAFQSYFSASDRGAAAERVPAIVKTGVSFEEAVDILRQGRDYGDKVGRGLQYGRTSVEHHFVYVVPESYDPTLSYQVKVYLHDGVRRARPLPLERLRTDVLPSPIDEIGVYPAAWTDSAWWSASQVDNLGRILDRLKRAYNIDENRIFLTGTSDGGTGAYFMAFKDTTPWAAFLPMIGDMTVLGNPRTRVDAEIYPGNAVNKPLYIVNTGLDRLYPAHTVQPYVEHLQKLGARAFFRVYADADHSTVWWHDESSSIEEFVHDHQRDPLPSKISWETERVDRFNRAHWLIIDRLGEIEEESQLADSNVMQRGLEYDFGLRLARSGDRRRVGEVSNGSNAARMGLREGDRLVEVNGTAVEAGIDLTASIQRWKVGDEVSLVVERGGRKVPVQGRFEPSEIEAPPTPIFPRRKPSGRVDVVRKGNVVEASTRGVAAFTLLLSPSVFDFDHPVRVIANGKVVFDGPIERSLATLLKWAARDDDRTMLFGAELAIDLRK